jgi:large subunit ribosomal protein L9
VKVVFVQEVLGTAVPGDVKEVKNGFARNYLIPRGLAVPATKEALQRAEALAKREAKRQAALDSEAQRIVERLQGQTLTIRARAGEQGRLYGSVTASDIAGKLTELLGEEFDRRRVLLHEPIRTLGTHTVTLRLTRNISHQLDVEVEPEDGRRRAAAAPPAPPVTPVEERPAAAEEEAEDDDDAEEEED